MGLAGGPYHPPGGVHTACTEADSCALIQGKIWLLQRMIKSHEGWDRYMPAPRGGSRHATDIAQLYVQLANCQFMYAMKCGCTPDPDPQTQPSPGSGGGLKIPPIFPFWWVPPVPNPERN